MPRAQTNYGPPVVYGGTPRAEIRYLSVSQIERYDRATEGGCPRKWWFRYIAKLSEPQRKSQKLGDQVHAQLEHYSRTGEDVLGEVARAGRRFLPKPGPDLEPEYEFARMVDSRESSDRTLGPVRGRVASELMAGEIPVVGYIDLPHARGEWINDSGIAQAESRVAEVIDHKTTKQIENEVDEVTGVVVKQGWAKSAEALAKTWQMTGYGVVALAKWPEIVAVRLSHQYFQTQGRRAAKKVSARVEAAEIRERWARSSEVAESMRATARVAKVEDVEANYSACGAYGGCAYKAQCPRDPKIVLVEALTKRRRGPATEAEGMSILDRMKARQAEKSAEKKTETKPEVEAEKAKLLAEEAQAKAKRTITPPDLPSPKDTHEPIPDEAPPEIKKFAKTCPADGAELTSANASKLPDGTVKHIGCAATACIPAGQRELTTDEAVDKKVTCPCGQSLKVSKPQKLPDGKWYGVVKEHGPKMKITVEQDDGSMKPLEKAEKPPAEITPAPTEKAPEKSDSVITPNGLDLYLDCYPDGVAVQRLEPYAEQLAGLLAEHEHVADVRCVPKDSPLAYGGWRGALTAAAKAEPPAAGAYVVDSRNELAAVVAAALTPQARTVVRGVR